MDWVDKRLIGNSSAYNTFSMGRFGVAEICPWLPHPQPHGMKDVNVTQVGRCHCHFYDRYQTLFLLSSHGIHSQKSKRWGRKKDHLLWI